MTPEPTHTIPLAGHRIPVRIIGPSTYGCRPALRVEAAAGEPFRRYTHGGWVTDNRADYPADLVRAIGDGPDAATLALGLLLLDPEAPAEAVNAALAEWKAREPRFAEGDDPDDLECGCNGFNADRCPACDAELAGDTIPFTNKEI